MLLVCSEKIKLCNKLDVVLQLSGYSIREKCSAKKYRVKNLSLMKIYARHMRAELYDL